MPRVSAVECFVPQTVSVKQLQGLEVPSSRVRFTWSCLCILTSPCGSPGRSTETRMMGGCRMIFNCLRLSWMWENHASKLNQHTVHFLSWGFKRMQCDWEAVFSSTIKRPDIQVFFDLPSTWVKACTSPPGLCFPMWICFSSRHMHSLNASLVSPSSRIFPPNIPFQYLLLLLAFFFPHIFFLSLSKHSINEYAYTGHEVYFYCLFIEWLYFSSKTIEYFISFPLKHMQAFLVILPN